MRGALKYKTDYKYKVRKCVGLSDTEGKILLGFHITESRRLLLSFMALEYWKKSMSFFCHALWLGRWVLQWLVKVWLFFSTKL